MANPQGTTRGASHALSNLEETTSTTDWINHNVTFPTDSYDLDDPEPLLELDHYVVQLLGILDIAVDETASDLERSITEIGRGIPRLTYDLNLMREGAFVLQSSLAHLQQRTRTVGHEEITHTLNTLHLLDRGRRNMEAARQLLLEAQSWNTLESEVTSLLVEQSYEKAAERLSEATKSVVVFENTPEYDARRTLLVSLQNQLEASLSSALVTAFNTQDVAVSRRFYTVFRNIDRETEFRNYYYGSRRSELLKAWRAAVLAECSSTGEPPEPGCAPKRKESQRFSTFLASFYAALLSVVEAERQTIPSIFPDPESTLSSLIVSIFSSLDPSMSDRLTSVVSYHGASAIHELINAFRATQDFSAALSKSMEKTRLASAHPSWLADDAASRTASMRTHIRRRSERLSFSRRLPERRMSTLETDVSQSVSEWEQAIFESFIPTQSDYGILEIRALDEALRNLMNPSTSRALEADAARLLRERTVDVLSLAEDSLGRCMSFTYGIGAFEAIRADDHLLASFVNMSSGAIFGAGYLSLGREQLSVPVSEELSHLDYSGSDWSGIQSCLRLLESLRSLLDRVSAFELKLSGMLVQVAATLKGLQDEAPHVTDSNRGSIRLLANSVLNSASLHHLLHEVESKTYETTSPSAIPSQTQPLQSQSRTFRPLLEDSRSAISAFARRCQGALQDIILSPLRQRLSSYPTLSDWATNNASSSQSFASSISNLQVPSFSLSPTSIMQDLTEGLLNLPRLFEIYAEDEALSFSVGTLPFLRSDVLAALWDQTTPVIIHAIETSRVGHARRSPSLSVKSVPLAMPSHLSPESVTSAWLSALGSSVTSHFVQDVLPQIQRLTDAGAAQLSSDLEYLCTIVAALNVESDDLKRWKECVDMDSNAYQAFRSTNGEPDQILNLVARMRGW
ncbi:hypothetical protein PUNSTDRAFT_122273 [Punctularia strigosozonata HHB-11173 SS5]|uniref:uncharacterized protein n=1 Tax=Punctularia strigosozonata (strain HHB-11173) TaxID=741275 RepID=UPI0004418247|nr:uncharacterized protein PUNSTDRAFT_122273 [Punctularia strigosozonata HHB-11173 SS5]EIN05885.1 hypothetical protein PUNSTDRAFT_122273 [Punctularia strigosozonata HHB-11173 SS5]